MKQSSCADTVAPRLVVLDILCVVLILLIFKLMILITNIDCLYSYAQNFIQSEPFLNSIMKLSCF